MNLREVAAQLQRFDEDYIPFPPFVAALDAIESHLTLFRESGLVQNLLVLGESGTGKSSLCRWLTNKYPKVIATDRDILPVLFVSIPPGGTVPNLAESILAALGDPDPSQGKNSVKTARIVKLCAQCKVELLLLDEAQHLHDRGQAGTHYYVADWLKSLLDALQIPAVFLGLPRLETLLQVNEQLRRRFTQRLHLSLGQGEAADIHHESLQLFVSLGACLSIPLTPAPFSWDELGMRIFFASDGRVAYVKKLLAGAYRQALENQLPVIDPPLLAQIFRRDVWVQGVGALNPFEQDFEFRRLDRGFEPFERGTHYTSGKRGREAP
ncbi:AAA family ATPase [Paludibacterium sp. dN 18-1]|uniref:AAA family ATPase n=1 Tax=Paludibacterium denitrificans TaxID=2675226 RepID=A0A844GBP6_9NEIS|nr:AAA family ATPase [Paludibacterium denitrificans]